MRPTWGELSKLEEFLEELENDELLIIHNNYCETVSSDGYIMYMEELNDYMDGLEPLMILQLAFNGEFNPNHDYFTFNGYGNLQSIHEWDLKDYIYLFDIVRHCTENDDDLGDEGIREILDEEDIKLGWLNHTVKSIKDIFNIEEITYQDVERLYPSVREKIKEINKELIFKNEEFMED